MRWLSVTPENFENQRAVVEEEFRMRIQNQAYVPGEIRLGEIVFKGYEPYAHPTIEHFAPMFVTLGAATNPQTPALQVIDGFWIGLAKRSFQVV